MILVPYHVWFVGRHVVRDFCDLVLIILHHHLLPHNVLVREKIIIYNRLLAILNMPEEKKIIV